MILPDALQGTTDAMSQGLPDAMEGLSKDVVSQKKKRKKQSVSSSYGDWSDDCRHLFSTRKHLHSIDPEAIELGQP
mgnify:CR=1 FL=1